MPDNSSRLNISQESQSNLDNLIKLIADNRSCAFIGAGLSFGAGYPLWEEIINKFLKRIEELSKACPPLDKEKKKWEHIEIFREILEDEEYRKTIIDLFGNNGKERFLSKHLKIISTPYTAYITTNFDCCLENAAEDISKKIKIQIYPALDITKVREGPICHIHGYIDPDNPKGFVIVLSTRDYEKAYKSYSFLTVFLKVLFEKFSIVFIGYSLGDDELINIMDETNTQLSLASKDEEIRKLGELKIKKHYILLHENSKTSQEIINNLGLIPIYYRGEDERHSELEKILEYIRRWSTNIQLPRPIICKDQFEA